jgi:asparagine synthase (glutamine-hydrolysing)
LIGPDGTTKRIMRTAMKGLAPQPILDRRDKVGFETPESSWVRQQAPWVRSLVTKERLSHFPILNSSALSASLDRVFSGKDLYQSWVWRVLNFIRWAELNQVHLTI